MLKDRTRTNAENRVVIILETHNRPEMAPVFLAQRGDSANPKPKTIDWLMVPPRTRNGEPNKPIWSLMDCWWGRPLTRSKAKPILGPQSSLLLVVDKFEFESELGDALVFAVSGSGNWREFRLGSPYFNLEAKPREFLSGRPRCQGWCWIATKKK